MTLTTGNTPSAALRESRIVDIGLGLLRLLMVRSHSGVPNRKENGTCV